MSSLLGLTRGDDILDLFFFAFSGGCITNSTHKQNFCWRVFQLQLDTFDSNITYQV